MSRLSSRTSSHKSGTGSDDASPTCRVEAVANDVLRQRHFPERRTLPVGTAETLHGFGTLSGGRTDGLELSLKLYHPRELQLGYQQSITEAPSLENTVPNRA